MLYALLFLESCNLFERTSAPDCKTHYSLTCCSSYFQEACSNLKKTVFFETGSGATPCREMQLFSRMRSEGSRFIWGCGGEAVFAESCVCVRNRSQPFATVCVTAVRLSTVASASGLVLKVCEVDPLSSQIYWSLQRRCLCE